MGVASLAARVAGFHRRFDARVWLLTYGQAMLSTGRGIIMPFATLYFYNVRHFPLTLVGLAFAIAFPLGSLMGLAWGAVADRIGRKPLMMFGFLGQAMCAVAFAFVVTVPAFFGVTILNAIALSAWNPAARAMVADVTPEDRRGRAYGLLYLSNNLGLSIGLLLGAILVIYLPYRALFLAEAAGATAYLLVVILAVQESHRAVPGERPDGAWARVKHHVADLSTPLRDRTFLLLLGVAVLGGIGWNQFYSTYAPFMKNEIHATDFGIGVVVAINTVMVVALQVPLSGWADKRTRTKVLLLGNVLLLASLLLNWASTGRSSEVAFGIVALGVVVMTVGEIVNAGMGPALAAGMAKVPTNYGKYMAAMDMTWSLSAGLGSVLGGVFFDAHLVWLLWPVTATLVAASLVGFWWLGRILPGEIDRPSRAPPEDVAPA